MSWGLALHGGSFNRYPRRGADPAPYIKALSECRDRGVAVLTGKSKPSFSPHEHLNPAMQAVIETVIALEDCPLFNAGRGSVLNELGKFEMDAQVMDNRGHCGACTGLTSIRNPVLAAERIMTKSKHAFITSPGAEQFAIREGLRTESFDYFLTEAQVKQLEIARKSVNQESIDYDMTEEEEAAIDAAIAEQPGSVDNGLTGTVGAVAKDAAGNYAFAISTGGLTNKMQGRVGDTPILGAGGYVNDMAAVCATGVGELFLYHNVCGQVCAAMEYGGMSLQEASRLKIGKLPAEAGGVIGVDSDGRVVFEFSSVGVMRAMAESSGRRGVALWEEWEEKNF